MKNKIINFKLNLIQIYFCNLYVYVQKKNAF